MQHWIAEEQGGADRSTEVAARIMDPYRERIDADAPSASQCSR
ncbi:hypothetical protein [Sphingomonas hominis]|nr:hypothetical protein [Sphingomonas hominis]